MFKYRSRWLLLTFLLRLKRKRNVSESHLKPTLTDPEIYQIKKARDAISTLSEAEPTAVYFINNHVEILANIALSISIRTASMAAPGTDANNGTVF